MAAIAVEEQSLMIAEVAELTGVTAHTLRYYERIGLLDVDRQAGVHRRIRNRPSGVVIIGRLRAAAMPSARSALLRPRDRGTATKGTPA